MTVDRSKIDEICREKLSRYDVIPPYTVWKDIMMHIHKRKKARMRRMYYRVAASAVVLLTVGTLLLRQADFFQTFPQTLSRVERHSFENIIIQIEVPGLLATKEAKFITRESSPPVWVAGKTEEDDSMKEISSVKNITGIVSQVKEEAPVMLKAIEPMITGVSSNVDHLEKIVRTGTPASENVFSGHVQIAMVSEVSKTTHFSLKASMAPVMSYRRLQNNSSPASFNTSESELFSYSGGVDFGYKLTNRLSVRSGFYYSQIGQTMNEISLGSDDFTRHNEETFIRLNNSLGQVDVDPSKLLSAKPPEDIDNIMSGNRLLKSSYRLNSSVIQRFDYVRIPLMFEYTMIDKKIDLNVVGGVNSNFLVNEGVYLKNGDGNTTLIGNTTEIRQLNYSGSVGLALEYRLAEQVNMYFEPHMDYFLNPINYSETKTYPYSFAIFTGLNISF